MSILRVSIDGSGFATLVKGQVAKFGNIEILLEDIGFDVMRHYIDEAEREQRDKGTSSSYPSEL